MEDRCSNLRQRGSMKGAVNINTSPSTGRRNETYRGGQPCLRRDDRLNQLCGNSVLHHHGVSSSETEKRRGGRWSPTTVLFESQWTTAFHGRARGDRVLRGPSAEAATTASCRILTLDLMRSEHTDDEVSNLS